CVRRYQFRGLDLNTRGCRISRNDMYLFGGLSMHSRKGNKTESEHSKEPHGHCHRPESLQNLRNPDWTENIVQTTSVCQWEFKRKKCKECCSKAMRWERSLAMKNLRAVKNDGSCGWTTKPI